MRYTLGVVKKEIKPNKIFLGLAEALLSKADRDQRGKGMQNFRYAPAFEEFMHIINIHSPRAYRFIQKNFPAPSDRHFRFALKDTTHYRRSSYSRLKEARQPRFPITICDQTFESVKSTLEALQYDGPVVLSCDDTKLFESARMYWDGVQKAFFVVGIVDGPVQVSNPDDLQAILKNKKLASKVCLFQICDSAANCSNNEGPVVCTSSAATWHCSNTYCSNCNP